MKQRYAELRDALRKSYDGEQIRTEEQIVEYSREAFEIVDFHPVDDDDLHFQALTLARPLV